VASPGGRAYTAPDNRAEDTDLAIRIVSAPFVLAWACVRLAQAAWNDWRAS
jgi:hypothetical protein